jgi:transcriptional regulator with XRE-family HTH domain
VSATADFPAALHRWRHHQRLSQLELAVRAGTTQRHVSFLERGRSTPGRALVVRLAESLQLTLRDRNALLLAAGYAPVYPESDLDDPALGPVLAAVRGVLAGHEPYPAVITSSAGDLVLANEAASLLTDGAAPELLRPPVNALRLALHPGGLAPRIVNLAEWGRHIIDSLRARARRTPDRAAIYETLADELEGYVTPAPPGPDHMGFAVPLRLRSDEGELRLITTLTSFATAVDVTLSELHLEAFLPADELTAAALWARAAAR